MTDVLVRSDFSNEPDNYRLFMWCPGCEDIHAVNNTWTWNGDTEKPTFGPSILVTRPGVTPKVVCHSFVENGIWRYLPDSTHALKGLTAPMVPMPDGLMD